MAYDPNPSVDNQEKKSIFGVIVHSFFVVPFLLAVFSVLLFASVRILTMEKHSVYDYLHDIREGGLTKRWQAAFELSRILVNKKEIPQEQKFFDEMSAAYSQSVSDDSRVRQYLALAMAQSQDERFVPVLLEKIAEEKDENLYAIITALGILKQKSSVTVLLKYLESQDPHIRLATVIALGNIGDTSSLPALQAMLNDGEVNIVWDAAIALAKMGDLSAKPMLLKMMDRSYLSGFKEVDDQEQAKIISVAMQATMGWKDSEIDVVLKNIFNTDKNMNVRTIAQKVLEQKNKV